MMSHETMPLPGYVCRPDEEVLARAPALGQEIALRRTVRDFSDRPVPREIIAECVRTAGQ